MHLWNGGPSVKGTESTYQRGSDIIVHHFRGYEPTLTAWTKKNKELTFGILRMKWDTTVSIISKCEGINFLTVMDLSKLVDH